MRTQRLFSILDMLRSRRYPVAASVLSEELGVSLRTLYRDMSVLRDMGAPIRGEAGVGYQLDAGYFMPPLSLDPDERDALIMGISMLARDAKTDKSLIAASRRLISKLESSDRVAQTLDRPLMAIGHSAAPPKTERLRHAIQDRLKVSITYSDATDQISCRTVRPLGLTVFDSGWLLTAWCE